MLKNRELLKPMHYLKLGQLLLEFKLMRNEIFLIGALTSCDIFAIKNVQVLHYTKFSRSLGFSFEL